LSNISDPWAPESEQKDPYAITHINIHLVYHLFIQVLMCDNYFLVNTYI